MPLQSSAARSGSPASSTAYGSAATTGGSSRVPARRRQRASSPASQAERRRTASSRAASVAATTSACRPSSQAASALAVRQAVADVLVRAGEGPLANGLPDQVRQGAPDLVLQLRLPRELEAALKRRDALRSARAGLGAADRH